MAKDKKAKKSQKLNNSDLLAQMHELEAKIAASMDRDAVFAQVTNNTENVFALNGKVTVGAYDTITTKKQVRELAALIDSNGGLPAQVTTQEFLVAWCRERGKKKAKKASFVTDALSSGAVDKKAKNTAIFHSASAALNGYNSANSEELGELGEQLTALLEAKKTIDDRLGEMKDDFWTTYGDDSPSWMNVYFNPKDGSFYVAKGDLDRANDATRKRVARTYEMDLARYYHGQKTAYDGKKSDGNQFAYNWLIWTEEEEIPDSKDEKWFVVIIPENHDPIPCYSSLKDGFDTCLTTAKKSIFGNHVKDASTNVVGTVLELPWSNEIGQSGNQENREPIISGEKKAKKEAKKYRSLFGDDS